MLSIPDTYLYSYLALARSQVQNFSAKVHCRSAFYKKYQARLLIAILYFKNNLSSIKYNSLINVSVIQKLTI